MLINSSKICFACNESSFLQSILIISFCVASILFIQSSLKNPDSRTATKQRKQIRVALERALCYYVTVKLPDLLFEIPLPER